MASYGAILRPSAAAAAERAKESLRSTHRALTKLHPSQIAFTLPPDLESAAVRAARNLVRLRLHYAVVLYTALGSSLLPARIESLLILTASSFPAAAYALLLRAAPSTALLHPVVDRVVVAALFVVANLVQLVMNAAMQHLLVVSGAWIAVVLVHAVLRMEEDEEMVAFAVVGDKEEGDGDVELGP